MHLSPEHLRVLDDSATSYDTWMDAQRRLSALGPPLHWKTIRGTDYLYEVRSANGGTSHGRRSRTTEELKSRYDAAAEQLRTTLTSTEERLQILAAQYRALRLPRIHPTVGAICREADRRRLLGKALLVVGTNAMPAYEIEAQERFLDGLTATQDCDLAWCATTQLTATGGSMVAPRPVFALLKAVDSSFVVNMERPFQARNRHGYEVELLIGTQAATTLPRSEDLRPTPLPEQDWLARGQQLSHVVFDMDHKPVRLVVPDPRWMALHKLWLAEKPERNSRKVPKDAQQGARLAQRVSRMPRFRIDEAFSSELPEELKQYLPSFAAKT